MSAAGEVTEILLEWRKGDRTAETRLFGLVYQELHRMAARYMVGERSDHSLQPTALVHEVYLRLIQQNCVTWEDRSHFFAITSRLMRRILVDHARARNAEKRPRPGMKVPLSDLPLSIKPQTLDLVVLDEALKRLESIDARQARIVEMRFIAGLSEDEIASALGISVRTVKRDWRMARAWLYGAMRKESNAPRAMGAS